MTNRFAMKKITPMACIAMLLLTTAGGCSKNDVSPVLSNVKSSVLEMLPFQTVTLEEAKANEVLITIAWSATELYLDDNPQPAAVGPIRYTVEVARAGTGFESPAEVTVTPGLSVDLTTAQLNDLLKGKLQAEPATPLDVEFRVLARYGENNPEPVASGNTLLLTATVYEAADAMQPLYLVGDMNGWDNTNTDFVVYRTDNDENNRTYTYTGRLGAGVYFKFVPQEALGTFRMYCREAEGTLVYETLEGGAFYNEVEGYYTVTLNLDAMTYTIEPYTGPTDRTYGRIGPIGDFSGWDNEPPMTKTAYDPHQWHGVFTFNEGTTVKFRGDNDWSNNWGAGATDIPWGLAVFDGPGAAVPAGTYHIYFNDLTGRYLIWPQD